MDITLPFSIVTMRNGQVDGSISAPLSLAPLSQARDSAVLMMMVRLPSR
jgi:hypothetical protein